MPRHGPAGQRRAHRRGHRQPWGSDFKSVDMQLLGRRRTYPGLFPVLHLDHFYFDNTLRLIACRLQRSKLALVASDHLLLVAEFEVPASPPAKAGAKHG
jgi:endonuclease/exonuclease/phosphatase family metal-dependent hydrolase